MLLDKYEDVKPWNSKYENFVKLYLTEKKNYREGLRVFTEEEYEHFKKLPDDSPDRADSESEQIFHSDNFSSYTGGLVKV